MKINVKNMANESVKDLTLADSVWNIEINEAVMHDAIVLAQASVRQGTASTKTRSEVSGGGIVFGPKPRKYNKKQNRKERRLALKSALSCKFQDKELVVVENLNLETNKTKNFNEILKNLNIDGKALVVYADENENLFLASRNNNKVAVVSTDQINVLDLVAASHLLIDESSVKKIEEVLD